MWDDITKSIKASLHDRTSSPLAGAFFVSWCVINYEILVLLLLGDDKPVARIENIKHLAYMNWAWTDGPLHLFGLPLTTALFWIFVYPYPSKWVFKFSKARSEELISLKNEIEKKTLLTQEQSDEIRVQMEKTKHEYAQMLKEKDATIEALNRKNSELQLREFSGKSEISETGQQESASDQGKDSLAPKDVDDNNSRPGSLSYTWQTEEAWRREYQKMDHRYLVDFDLVLRNIYGASGQGLTVEQIMKYHPMGLIEQKNPNSSSYSLTEKGKSFAKWHHLKTQA